MNFTPMIDELDRPEVHVNDLISVLEETISTLDSIKRIAGSGLDYHEATALNRLINRNRSKLFAILDRVQSIPDDVIEE